MKQLSTIALGVLLTSLSAFASTRMAVVRVTDLYRDMPSTQELQERIQQQKNDIMKDQRAEELRRVITELQELQAQLQDKSSPPDEETSRKLARDYELKRQEAQTLQQEFENFRKERNKEINREMVESMRKSLNLIVEISNKIAKEEGYDAIIDSSGNTNTGVPFLLYSKDGPDLTETVKAALHDALAKQKDPAEQP